MTKQLSVEQTRLLRLRSQRLHPETAKSISDVAQLVKELGGLQSQELSSTNLAVRARTSGLIVDDVKYAREVERSIVLTWAMRGTLHLIATEDLEWLLTLLGPLFIRKSERRYQQLKLDEETRRTAARVIRDVLSNRGPLNRAELAQAIATQGIPVEGQAIYHLVRYAALEGTICFGPERNGELTYVVLDDWLRSKKQRHLTDEQILAELARRYLQAHAPATPYDLANWSGITFGQAKAGFKSISSDLIEVKILGSPAWILKHHSDWFGEPSGEHIVRLLPRYDEYLLGYKSRELIVSDAYAKRIHPGGGQINQSLIVAGLAIASWRNQHKKNNSTIIIEPFEPISSDLVPYIEAEVQDIGRFLQQETQLQL
jgi:hypothetical protein